MDRSTPLSITLLITLSLPLQANAHSKWFSRWQDNLEPATVGYLAQWSWLALVVFALLAVFLSVCLWHSLPHGLGPRLTTLTDRVQNQSYYRILAIAAVMSIALCWRDGVILTPELAHDSVLVSLIQFGLITLGLLPQYRVLLPLLLASLYVVGAANVGPLHMLDYAHCLGIALCLWHWRASTGDRKIQEGLRILQITTGFSLCWLGMEKVIHPQWSLEVLALKPWLSMGLPESFFVKSAALVEFTIGFFLLTGLWTRLSALILSLLMAFTATLFGIQEILGHLPIHAVLLVLIIAPVQPPAELASAARPPLIATAGRYTALYLLVMATLGGVYYGFALQACSAQGHCAPAA
ncbi:DoxX family protein [Marinobacter sp. SS21]|uniref:DoxX family protein n=1 Tax=Marinobacter sp. SS21 TaxID=2979460 RepID=UPI00232B50EC|nr:DoxX family membrane protein [Marinobacter sp. SS21]MDC0662358.1 DoxX family membrane protein [Marinobacter sp. SS21]